MFFMVQSKETRLMLTQLAIFSLSLRNRHERSSISMFICVERKSIG